MPPRAAVAPIFCVVGARPNLMKIAAVIRAMRSATPPMPAHILAAVDEILRTGGKAGRVPELWDGRASQRIAAVLREWLDRGAERLVANAARYQEHIT